MPAPAEVGTTAARARRARGELQHALQGLLERRHVEDLRTDVAVDSRHVQVRQPRREGVGGGRAVVRDPELVALEAGGNVGVGARVDVGVHAKGHGRANAHGAGDGVEPLELGLALDVEAAYPGRERGTDLVHALAHAREDDPVGAPAGRQHARELAPGDDVEAGAEREDAEHGEVGVRLDRSRRWSVPKARASKGVRQAARSTARE
jgi:hypothetical protein